jgi:mannan endo-1,4-beta-mannosidase
MNPIRGSSSHGGRIVLCGLTLIASAVALTGCGGGSSSDGTSATAASVASAESVTSSSTSSSSGSSSSSSSSSSSASIATTSPSAGAVARPSYNTGNGFFVANGQLYDPNGNPFRIRGVNRVHWDNGSAPGIQKSGANTERWVIDFTQPQNNNVSLIQSQSIQTANVPIVGNWNGTCDTDTGTLQSIVQTWVSQASAWTTLNEYLIVNIANEWGPADSSTWASAYESAIQQLRSAGYLGPLLIDSGQCGQDIQDLLSYSTAVFNSDPQKNVMFALHVYGNAQSMLNGNWLQQLATLSQQNGAVYIVGEFGPGNNIGPSPTEVTPGQVITAAESAGLGWLAWAWDDNDLANCQSDNNWFSMTYNCGVYTQASDLTNYGQDVVLNPTYGITALAKPASIYAQ